MLSVGGLTDLLPGEEENDPNSDANGVKVKRASTSLEHADVLHAGPAGVSAEPAGVPAEPAGVSAEPAERELAQCCCCGELDWSAMENVDVIRIHLKFFNGEKTCCCEICKNLRGFPKKRRRKRNTKRAQKILKKLRAREHRLAMF